MEIDVWRLTAIEIAFSIGMMVGGGVIASWGGFQNKIKTMTLALFGLAMPIFNTPTTVLLQEKIEEGFLGRVFGVMGMISTSMMPIGMLIFGPLADFIDIEWLLLGTGAFIIILSFFLGRDKVLIEAGKPTSTVQES